MQGTGRSAAGPGRQPDSALRTLFLAIVTTGGCHSNRQKQNFIYKHPEIFYYYNFGTGNDCIYVITLTLIKKKKNCSFYLYICFKSYCF